MTVGASKATETVESVDVMSIPAPPLAHVGEGERVVLNGGVAANVGAAVALARAADTLLAAGLVDEARGLLARLRTLLEGEGDGDKERTG